MLWDMNMFLKNFFTPRNFIIIENFGRSLMMRSAARKSRVRRPNSSRSNAPGNANGSAFSSPISTSRSNASPRISVTLSPEQERALSNPEYPIGK